MHDFTGQFDKTFLGVPNAERDGADVVTLLAPFDQTVCFTTGTARAPSAILRASVMIDHWDDELRWEPVTRLRFHTLPPVCPAEGETTASYHARLQEVATTVRGSRSVLLTIGGEHSITAPILRGLCKDPSQVTVVQIDAHADLLEDLDGEKGSHACVMKRIWDDGARLVQIGIRALERSELELQHHSDRIEVFRAHQLQQEAEREKLLQRLRRISGPTYLTIDVDGLDPSIVPGTGTPHPGGLGWYQTLDVLRAVAFESNADIIGVDVVETIPLAEIPTSEMAAAKLAFKSLSYFFNRRRS